jgi:hypothetical protein
MPQNGWVVFNHRLYMSSRKTTKESISSIRSLLLANFCSCRLVKMVHSNTEYVVRVKPTCCLALDQAVHSGGGVNTWVLDWSREQ